MRKNPRAPAHRIHDKPLNRLTIVAGSLAIIFAFLSGCALLGLVVFTCAVRGQCADFQYLLHEAAGWIGMAVTAAIGFFFGARQQSQPPAA